MQLHCHEHDEHRVSGVCVLTGEEGDCHGGAFFVEKGGIIHHEGKAIPTMGTRADGSFVEGYLCDAQQHGVVFDSHALPGPWPNPTIPCVYLLMLILITAVIPNLLQRSKAPELSEFGIA